MSRDDFDRYARWLATQRVGVRVFLIVGVPSITVSETLRWARLSARHAVHVGARHISLIPARSGHGWNGAAEKLPKLSLQHLAQLQHEVLRDVGGAAVVTIDTWDLETLAASDADKRTVRAIKQANLLQRIT